MNSKPLRSLLILLGLWLGIEAMDLIAQNVSERSQRPETEGRSKSTALFDEPDQEKTAPTEASRNEANKTSESQPAPAEPNSAKTESAKQTQITEAELAQERRSREAAKKRGEITFDDLKFEMEKGTEFKDEMLTEENKSLHKKTWKIRGYILPSTLFSRTNIREFVLVRDNQECCFGPGAALFDCVIVTMAPGKSINFQTRPVMVKGVLEIDTKSFRYPDTDDPYAVYKLTAEEVK